MSYGSELFEHIGIGREQGIDRPAHRSVDRGLRERINEANKSGDIVIPRAEGGYYRPDITKAEERADARLYIRQERARILDLQLKVDRMERTLAEQEAGL